MIESATFWKDGPEIETGEMRHRGHRHRGLLLPGRRRTSRRTAPSPTPSGMLQWHDKAVEPPGDARSDLWFFYHLGRRIREKLAGSTDERTGRCSTSPGTTRPRARSTSPSAEAVLREINGCGRRRRAAVELHRAEADDGSTTCGCWIYCGVLRRRRQPGRAPQAALASRTGSRPSGAGRGRRTGASSTTGPRPTPTGRPWSERKKLRLVGRRAGRRGPATTCPTSRRPSRPTTCPPRTPTGPDALARRATRSSCRPTARAGCTRPPGLADGPLPTHYEPHESPVHNALYAPAGQPGARASTSAATTRTNPAPPSRARGLPVRVHHLPADRAPHRRRHEPHAAVPLRAAAGDVLRGVAASWPPSAGSSTAAGRRSSPPARRSRPGCWSPTGCAAARRRAGSSTRSACPTTGAAGLSTGDSVNDLRRRGRSTRTSTSRRSRSRTCDIRPGPPPAGPGARRARRGLPPARAGIDRRTGTRRCSR